ncbi:MAG: ParB/RepB/Spo0J family partition protein [Firmicutes bacterium]|nr:ParB/RepB/Spo0J family partition protein [Bacillota bacterium]
MARAKLGGLGRGLDALFADLPAWEPETEETEVSETSEGSAAMYTAPDEIGSGRKKPAGAESVENRASARAETETEGPDAESKSAVQDSADGGTGRRASARPEDLAEDVVYVSIDDIKPNSMQPRKSFPQEALDELADSIREYGVIQPILVRRSGRGYELVAGERRWRAARLAGLKRVPAIVRELSDRENAFFALIENMQRSDLNSIEEAEGLSRMMDEFGLTHDEAGKAVGKSRAYVSNAIRLLKLPEQVKKLVASGELSAGHARAVAGLQGENLQIEIAAKAASEGWSVRKLESFTNAKATERGKASRKRNEKPAEVAAAEEELTRAMGTKVRISGSDTRGKLELEYYSRDELDRLIELLEAAASQQEA